MPTMAPETFMTVAEIAKSLRVSPYTVYDWLKSGRLKGFRPGGDKTGWRVRESEFERFITEREAESQD